MFLLQIALMLFGLLVLFFITIILAQAVTVSLLVLIDLWELACAPFVFLRMKLCREN